MRSRSSRPLWLAHMVRKADTMVENSCRWGGAWQEGGSLPTAERASTPVLYHNPFAARLCSCPRHARKGVCQAGNAALVAAGELPAHLALLVLAEQDVEGH